MASPATALVSEPAGSNRQSKVLPAVGVRSVEPELILLGSALIPSAIWATVLQIWEAMAVVSRSSSTPFRPEVVLVLSERFIRVH